MARAGRGSELGAPDREPPGGARLSTAEATARDWAWPDRTSAPSRAIDVATVLAGIAVVAVAAGFRLWNLDAIGFNSDEAVYTGQAAAMAGDHSLATYFSPFRAHPLLVQTVLAMAMKITAIDDAAARAIVAVLFGAGGVVATWLLARDLYGRIFGVAAAALLTFLPYHIVVSRQVMLDAALGMFIVLTLWTAYRYAITADGVWLLRGGLFTGLAFAVKETAVLLVPTLIVFFMWSRRRRAFRPRWVGGAALMASLGAAPFVLSRILFEQGVSSGYFIYQIQRPPNHEWWYFPVVMWTSFTPPFVIASVIGIAVMAIRRNLADRLVLSGLIVFGGFFQLWPTKLFSYLTAIAPLFAIAATIGVVAVASGLGWLARKAGAKQVKPITASLAVAALIAVMVPSAVLATTKGIEEFQGPFRLDVEVQSFAGAREVGEWASTTPEGSVFLTIGPSMGNLLSFYGKRDWYALSVSRDPRLRNPAYRPIFNPDLDIRELRIHYAVWDAYSADRSVFYNAQLNRVVRIHGGVTVFSAWRTDDGALHTGRVAPPNTDVRVIVYSLVGGDPISSLVDAEGEG